MDVGWERGSCDQPSIKGSAEDLHCFKKHCKVAQMQNPSKKIFAQSAKIVGIMLRGMC